MIRQKLWPTVAVLLLLAAAAAVAQRMTPKSSELAPFMGTRVFTMTNPQGSEQTVRIWDKTGGVGASLQIGKFPPNDITGILKDGDVLVLTLLAADHDRLARVARDVKTPSPSPAHLAEPTP